MTIDQFTKTSSPITVIVNIANPVAIKLAKILVEQGSKLLIIDKLSSTKKRLITDLLENDQCLFMDAESTFKNIEKFKKIDYVYYFLSQLVAGSTYPDIFAESMEIVQLTHKDFLKESNRVDAYVKLAVEFDAAFTLVSSAYVSQYLEPIPETNLQLQKYAESLVLDYVDRNRLNGRIVRVGELVGKDSDMASPTNLARLTREVILREKINIFGDGLQQNYLVNTEDAVYAVLKAAFSKEARGRTYMAVYPHPYTSLSIAYQLLELTAEEKEVVFNEVLPNHDDIAKLKDLCLAPSMTALGWEPQISLEQSLSETTEALATQLKQTWKQVQKTTQPTIISESGTQEDADLEKEKGVKLVRKTTKPPVITKVQTPSNNGKFLSGIYQAVIGRPLLALLSLPKILTTRYAKSSGKVKDSLARVVIVLLVTLLLGIVALPYIHFSITGVKLYRLFNTLKTETAALNSSNYEKYAQAIPTYIDSMAMDYKEVSYLTKVPSVGKAYSEGVGMITALQSYGKSFAVSLKAAAPVVKMTKGVASISPNNPGGTVTRDYYNEISEIMQQKQAFSQAVQDAKIGKTQLQSVDTTVFPRFLAKRLESTSEMLGAYTSSVDELSKIYDVIPYLLGYKDRRTYYLMVQNETELRSTGGWFSNYAIVGIENGQVREFTVNNVYDIDGKVNGLTAPADMQYGLQLPAKKKTPFIYKLSLANWDPELPKTAQTVSTVMSQAGIYKPNDVTITVTFQVIHDLMQVVGPIDIEGLGSVSAENMYEKVGVLHAQSVPGSQEKVKVVSDFLPKLLEKMVQSSMSQKQEMLKVFVESVKQKTIMVYSDNAQVKEKILDKYDTYRILTPDKEPLMAVDWNWGGNKANRYTKRVTDIDINEQTGRASIAMTYTNESKLEAYPQGTYVNVQRLYVPKEFHFTGASGYSTAPRTYATEAGVPYVLAELSVGLQQTKSGTMNFTFDVLPKQLSLYKQSGIDVEIVRVTITPATKSSKIDTTALQKQEYTEMSGKWFKTYVRKEDVVVKLAN